MDCALFPNLIDDSPPDASNRQSADRKKKIRITKKVWDAASNSLTKVAVEKEIPIKCVRACVSAVFVTHLQSKKRSDATSADWTVDPSIRPSHHTPPPPTRRKGWKNGTKITYEREGDELPGVIPADIVFILNTKPHPRYVRRSPHSPS